MTPIQSLSERLSRTVAEALTERGLSIRSLSDQTGIPLVTLSRRLNVTANSPLTAHEIDRIAVVLGLRSSDLLLAAEASPLTDAERAS